MRIHFTRTAVIHSRLSLALAWMVIQMPLRGWSEQRSNMGKDVSVLDYPSIQSALDANPGKIISVPAGDYTITGKIKLTTDNSGLVGPGRIIQSDPSQPILEIEKAASVRINGLTLTRPEGAMETNAEAVTAVQSPKLSLTDIRILNNRTLSSAIQVRESDGIRIISCVIENYMRLAVDDRTEGIDYGYAFNCINGSGIVVSYSKNVLIQSNRVVDLNFVPTRELKEKFALGKFVKKNATKGRIPSQKVWDEGYTDAWHQGSAIVVTAPEVSDSVQILGNSIENAAQGIDIHADHVIISQNIIANAFIGMKAMHGSRNVLIIGNQFSRNDLWSIGLMPGAASHAAIPASEGKPAKGPNTDGGSIIANNIISDFGGGSAHWIWGDQGNPIRFDTGQLAENPPLTDVVIQGNVIQQTGTAKFRFAVRIDSEAKGLHFSNNLFHSGTEGVSNSEMKP